jgi:alpha-L-rhamnosidase
VRVTSAGAATFDVSPPASGLAWAQGTVPTPRGPVAVHWRRSDDRDAGFALDVTVPAGARATIHLPARAVLEVGAGRYHFESGATTT